MNGTEGFFLVPISLAALATSPDFSMQSILGLVMLVSGVAGALYTTRNRADLAAKKELVATLSGEVQVFRAKSERLEVALRDEQSRRAAAEARTDITSLAKQIASNHQEMVALMGRLVEVIEAKP